MSSCNNNAFHYFQLTDAKKTRAHEFSKIIKMSVKGKIANFYHSKSKVVNALWILAQV